MNNNLENFSQSPLFESLSLGQVEKILNCSRVLDFRPGEIIMEEDQAGDSLFIILEGVVEVSKNLVKTGIGDNTADYGQSKTFARLDARGHAVFGEIGLLEESKRTATVKALTDCRLAEIRKEDFLRLAETDFEIGYRVLANVAKLMSTRLRKADEDIVKLTTVLTIVLKS
jgi:CRP/FNR family transcriptional regulator, cyclic AMP receptor protein